MEKNASNRNMEIYTPIEQAGVLIRERWANELLRVKVEEELSSSIPGILANGPSGLIWRCICTPDDEFRRFLDLCGKIKLMPVGFENSQDKFHCGNFTKYGLTKMQFKRGINKHLKHYIEQETVIDFNSSGGRRMCDLKTFWGENLVDFHHFFLQKVFPIMKNRVVDISEWLQRKGGSPDKYYFSVLSLSVCHAVYFDDYDLLESEKGFTDEIILPAFKAVKEHFGVKPVIVKVSNAGEHDADAYWWCYSKETKAIMENHIHLIKSSC